MTKRSVHDLCEVFMICPTKKMEVPSELAVFIAHTDDEIILCIRLA